MAAFSFNTKPPSSSSPSLFSFSSTPTSSASLFGASAPSNPAFGRPPSSTPSSAAPSSFGFGNFSAAETSSIPSSSFSLFGASAPSNPAFGSPPSSTPSSAAPSSFGFGAFPAPATSLPFGFRTTSSPAAASPFGGPNLFGSSPSSSGTTTTATTSSFGSSSSGTGNIFGASPSVATSSPFSSAFVSSSSSAVSSLFGTVSRSGSAPSTTSVFAGSSSSSRSSGFSSGLQSPSGMASNMKTASTTVATTAVSTSASTTASTATGSFTPASQPQSMAASSLFAVPAPLTTTSTVTTTTAQTSSAPVVSSSSGTSTSVSTAVASVPKLPSEITGKTVEEAEVAKVVDTQSNLEIQLEVIETHQQEVDKSLQSVEEETERIYKDEHGLLFDDEVASTRDAMRELAEYIERELEHMTEQIKSVIQTLNPNQIVPCSHGLMANPLRPVTEKRTRLSQLLQQTKAQALGSLHASGKSSSKKETTIVAPSDKTQTDEPVKSISGTLPFIHGSMTGNISVTRPLVDKSDPTPLSPHGSKADTATRGEAISGTDLQLSPVLFNPSTAGHVHVPNWEIKQGTRLTSAAACKNFLMHAAPPAETFFQANRPMADLLDDAAVNLVGTLVTVTEISRQWESYQEERRVFNQTREKFEHNRHRESVRIAELEKECKEIHARVRTKIERHKKACATMNETLRARTESGREAQAKIEELERQLAAKDEQLVAKDSRLADKDAELSTIRAQLEQSEEEKKVLSSENSTLREDRRWLISEGIPLSVEAVRGSQEFLNVVAEMLTANDLAGRVKGFSDGYGFRDANLPVDGYDLHGFDAKGNLEAKLAMFDQMQFRILEDITACADHDTLDILRQKFGLSDDGNRDEDIGEHNDEKDS